MPQMRGKAYKNISRILFGLGMLVVGYYIRPLVEYIGFIPLSDAGSAGVVQFSSSARLEAVRVIDGDTIQLADGSKVRYIGIDTPESVDPKKPVQCYAHEATQKNRELIEGKVLRFEKDTSNTDRYGRKLRYVWADDLFVNLELVRLGYARAVNYPPDTTDSVLFHAAENQAKTARRGLWGECETK